MKFTRSKLKQIIKEEVQKLNENWPFVDAPWKRWEDDPTMMEKVPLPAAAPWERWEDDPAMTEKVPLPAGRMSAEDELIKQLITAMLGPAGAAAGAALQGGFDPGAMVRGGMAGANEFVPDVRRLGPYYPFDLGQWLPENKLNNIVQEEAQNILKEMSYKRDEAGDEGYTVDVLASQIDDMAPEGVPSDQWEAVGSSVNRS